MQRTEELSEPSKVEARLHEIRDEYWMVTASLQAETQARANRLVAGLSDGVPAELRAELEAFFHAVLAEVIATARQDLDLEIQQALGGDVSSPFASHPDPD